MGKNYIMKSYYGDTFFEFILQPKAADAIVLLPGFPSKNFNDDILYFFNEKGYHVFFPRYKGSYQSNGKFLKTNIVTDLASFTKQLNKGKATNLWDNKLIKFKIKEKILLGGSFSGAIACGLAANTKEFSKIILSAPVWDFSKHNKDGGEQELHNLTNFVKKAYKNLYRFEFEDIQRELIKVKELDPKNYAYKLNMPILIFHDSHDETVSIEHTRAMVKRLKGAKLIEHSLGHGLSLDLMTKFYKDISKFIRYD
jgi:pimeloyl-ACP methyl ester carboxylesterase